MPPSLVRIASVTRASRTARMFRVVVASRVVLRHIACQAGLEPGTGIDLRSQGLLMAALSSSARDGTPYSVKRPDRDMSTAAFALNVRLSRRWLDRSHARWQDRPEMADGPSTQGQLQDRASSVMLPSTFSPAPAVWPYGPDHDLLRRAGHRDEGTSSPDK